MITNPLIQSEEKIKEELLQLVPFGTQMENVIQLVKSKEEWVIREINNENGFLYQGKAQRKVVGEKSVRVYLGRVCKPYASQIMEEASFKKATKVQANLS